MAAESTGLDVPDTMAALVRPRTTRQGDLRRGAASAGDNVIERAPNPYRRRASDRADERAARAAKLGDLVALWVASGQADAARQRRAEWEQRNGARDGVPARASSGG
jgi:hypothetical protein